MNKVWVTSDIHFGHKKIVEYTNRGVFTTQDRHDEDVIALWNSQVGHNDTVIQCGDFVFNCHNLDKWYYYTDRLNGRIIHIAGNHDCHELLRESGREWYDLKTKTFNVNGKKQQFVFCHYAMRVWQNSHRGSIHCFGHSHSSMSSQNGKSIDVGLDSSYNYFGEHRLFSLEDIVGIVKKIPIAVHDHHGRKEDD